MITWWCSSLLSSLSSLLQVLWLHITEVNAHYRHFLILWNNKKMFCSAQSLDRLGRRKDFREESAEILFLSFLWEAILSSSGMDGDVHSLKLCIQPPPPTPTPSGWPLSVEKNQNSVTETWLETKLMQIIAVLRTEETQANKHTWSGSGDGSDECSVVSTTCQIVDSSVALWAGRKEWLHEPRH